MGILSRGCFGAGAGPCVRKEPRPRESALELVYLVAVGIGLYFVVDGLIRLGERIRGKPFADRTLIFFVVFLVLALAVFRLIRTL